MNARTVSANALIAQRIVARIAAQEGKATVTFTTTEPLPSEDMRVLKTVLLDALAAYRSKLRGNEKAVVDKLVL